MPTSPKRRDANQITRAILETAESLFLEFGVENVSMHQIAKAVNIGQGTMYRRYMNKGDLCMDLMKENFRALEEKTLHYLEKSTSLSVKERMQSIFKQLLYFLDKHFRLFEVIHSYTICKKGNKQYYEATPYVFLHKTIQSLLEEAIEAKEIHAVDTNLTAHMLLSTLNPKMHMHLRKSNGYSVEEINESFNKTFLQPLFQNENG
ncbi:TetR/AcrR family transcriptional regulator [Bacillaceae bacterium Marseille-Q3522]|nr:TetR/AcrR family transcriptional regulator [Bacillaceae bacterium Marseille-Q3522]